MSIANWTRRGVLVGAGAALSACATGSADWDKALPTTANGADPLARYRLRADAPRAAWERLLPVGMRQNAPQILALSGEGEDGAFGAGALNGWSDAGQRPQFDIVTGISTGALIAPFAFLGRAYDATLRDMFLDHAGSDIARLSLGTLVRGGGLYDTEPLAELIAAYTPPAVLSAIAARHAQGARLLVVTTDLAASTGLVWDMGAIAVDGQTDLFRDVLRASSAIPGLFSPVDLRFRVNGQNFLETHVDGGVQMQFLAIPDAVAATRQPFFDNGRMYVIVNNTLDPAPQEASQSPLGVSQQAFTAMVRASARSGLTSTRLAAGTAGTLVFATSVSGASGIEWDASARFDADYMKAIYAHGYDRAVSGTLWDRA